MVLRPSGRLVQRLRDRTVRGGDPAALARYRGIDETMRNDIAAPVFACQGPGIHPALAVGVVGWVFGSDAVYTVDGGNTSLWAYSVLPATGPRSYLTMLELGMLGTGIPSAVGAKLGCPDRDVVCVTGDGAAGFNIMEMQTAVREKVAITTVIMSEGSWTMEEPNELELYGRTFGTAIGEIRWGQVAQGLGCHAEYVDDMAVLEPALRRAQEHDGPSVVCIRTSADANRAVPKPLWDRFFEVYSEPVADGG